MKKILAFALLSACSTASSPFEGEYRASWEPTRLVPFKGPVTFCGEPGPPLDILEIGSPDSQGHVPVVLRSSQGPTRYDLVGSEAENSLDVLGDGYWDSFQLDLRDDGSLIGMVTLVPRLGDTCLHSWTVTAVTP